MSILFTILFWSVFATVLACMEIESEGEYGWAEKAPTWFRTTGFAARVYGLFMGGKPLTGYHLFTFLMPFILFHAHFAMGTEWTLDREFLALAMYFAVCPLWDYFWFVLNPWYEGKFTKKDVWWHSKSIWILGLFPMDYLVGALVSLGFAGLAAWWIDDSSPFTNHSLTMLGFLGYTAFLHLAAPLYRRWYLVMRNHDDRDKVQMTHTHPPFRMVMRISREEIARRERHAPD